MLMKTNFLNLVAKMPQNTGGGNSQTKRATLALPLRYLCAMLLVLVLGVGNMWGAELSESIFIQTYSAKTGDSDPSTSDLSADFPAYLTQYNSPATANGNGCSSAVTSPHDFKSNIASGTKYWRFKCGNGKGFQISSVSNIKTIHLYGNGSSSTRTVTAAVSGGTLASGAKVTKSFTNGNTSVVDYTFDISALTNYSADDTYTITITPNGDIHVWGIYLEAGSGSGGGDTPSTYTVTYDGNGKTSGDVPTDSNSPYAKDAEVTVLGNTGSLAKTNYTFTGWNTEANGSGTHYDAGDKFDMGTANVTLYAQWEYNFTTHSPGIYKSTEEGGYGRTLKSVGGRDYEVYLLISETSDKGSLYAGPDASTTDGYALFKNAAKGTMTAAIDGWLILLTSGYSGSGNVTTDEFSKMSGGSNLNTHYAAIQNTHYVKFKISGYDQFSFIGRDNHASNDGKQFVVKIDGEAQTYTHNGTDNSIFRFDISTGTHIIEITGNGANDNRFRGFSLRLPEAACSAPTSPTITATPASAAYTEGNNISLTASATGTDGSTTYTWYKGADWATASAGSSIGSAATYTKNSCVEGDAGTYWCNISNGTGCEVQVSKTITVAAAPVANPVITAAVNEDEWGSVSPANITVSNGDAVSIDGAVLTCGEKTLTATATTATAEYTYTFVNWTGVSNGDEITANTTATANFSRTANSYDVNYTAPTNGSYTIKVGDASAVSENTTAAYGTTVTLAATPASGYKFTGWTVAKAAGTVTVTNNQFTMPAEAVTVSAAFEQVCYLTLYDLVGEVGSAEVTAGDAAVNEGESLVMSNTDGRIKLSPVSGQKIKNGDEVIFEGSVNAASNKKKPFGIKFYAQNGTTSAGDIKTAEDKCADDGTMMLSGTLSNLGDGADYIYIARSGGTTTTLTSCVVRREITCPEELDAITGLAVSAKSSTSLTFEWDAVTNASSYDVYLYEDEDCKTLVGSKANVTTNSKEFTGLTPNTDYYCKVQAIGDGVSYTDGPLSDYLNGKTDEAPKYDVTYASTKGVAPAAAEQVYSVVLPQISPVTGFVHTGWTADQTVVVDEETVTVGTTIAIGKTAVLSANTTFTAVWTIAYTLTLDPKGGTIADATGWTLNGSTYEKVVTSGEEVELPTFTKAERTFKTWRKAGPADVESPVTVTGDLTLTAVWNATVEQVIYSWEGAEGGATEFGGTATSFDSDADSFNNKQINAKTSVHGGTVDYYCICLNGNADYTTNFVKLALDQHVQAGDKVEVTAFYNKKDNSTGADKDAKARPQMHTMSGTEIFVDDTDLPNLNTSGSPTVRIFTVPESIDTDELKMTRKETGSNTWISRLRIYREVVTEEGNLLIVTLNYNDGGATENGSIAVLSGQKVAQPANPTWAHHRFNGWKLNSSAYDFSSAVTEDITLVADWTQLYTITFAAGDGSGDAPEAIADKAQSETFLVPANTFTAPDGKEFSKWNDGSADYKAGDTYTVGTANVVLTAQWIIIPDRYTVIYMDGENELGREEVEVGSKPAGIAEPKKALFAFASWQESGSDIALDANSWTSRVKNAEVTLTVRWETGYATTIDYEGFIDVNGTGGNWQAELLNHCYAISGTEGVTLDAPGGKPADKGLKIKNDGTTVTFNAAAGKLVTLKVGVLSGAKFSEDNGSNYTTLTGASDSYSASKFIYYYHAEATTYKFATTTDSYNILKKVSITAPYVVTFSAEYGTTPAAQTFYGTGLTLPTEIAGTEKRFGGWYTDEARTEEVTLTGGKFIPTGDCTLYAKQLDKSDDATLSDLKVDDATVTGFAANTYIYKIEVPYGTEVDALPKITKATPTDANATYRLSPAAGPEWNDTYQCYLQQVIVTPEDEVTEHIKYYHVRITIADKEGVAMIAINVPAGNGNAQTIPDANISGYIGGTATQKIQSGKKLGSQGHYIGFTLANGETLKTGDILRLNVSSINGATAVTLFEDASSNHPVKAIPWTYKTGVNNIKLPEEVDGLNTLYIYRNDDSCNPTLTEVSIIRPMNPVITEFELGGAVGEVDEPNKRIIVSLPKNTTLDEDGTPTTTIYSNTAEVSVGKTIVTNGGAWQYGDNTYRVTDKDGDYTDYTIRIYQQTRENLTAGKMSSSCYDRAVSMYRGVTFYELAGGLDGNIASDGLTGGAPTMLLFMEVERLEAGKPYLYVPTEDGQPMEVAFTGDAAGSEVDYRGFHGSFAGIPAAPDNILVNKYIVYNNTIQKCGQNCYIGANRAYFDIDEVPCYSTKEACYEAAEAEARTAGRTVKRLRRIALSNQETNTATALDAISEEGGVIVREGCYDVLGRKIEAPAQTGFYIVNGQKIIVR